jgi:hypothetical protein
MLRPRDALEHVLRGEHTRGEEVRIAAGERRADRVARLAQGKDERRAGERVADAVEADQQNLSDRPRPRARA